MSVPPLPADATSGGLAYHRLVFARRRTGWWTPLVVGLLGIGFYLVFTVLIIVVVGIAMFVDPEVAAAFMTVDISTAFDLTDPFMMAVLLASLVVMLPSYWLASLIVNGKRTGLVSSAAGRLRWRWMLLCTGAAIALFVVLSGVSMFLPADPTASEPVLISPADNPQLIASLLVILLVVPFQAAAEEYVFRGYLMQSIGRWLRHPLFAILLPVPIFVLGHGYDPLGQAGVGVFAIAAGWLTWRTGGLEAAIALHVVNNVSAFLLALAGFSDVNATSPGVMSFVWSLVSVGAYCAVVEWLVRRRQLPRTLVLTLPQPAPVYAAASPSASRIV